MPNQKVEILAQHAARSGYIDFDSHGRVVVQDQAPEGAVKRLREVLRVDNGLVSGWERGRAEDQVANWLRQDGVEWRPEQDVDVAAQWLHEQRQRERALRLAIAAEKARRQWEALGGPKSVLGVPRGSTVEVTESADGYVAHFRSGDLRISKDGTRAIVQRYRTVEITLLGIECQIRQEKIDEIYGVLTVIAGASGLVATQRFPASGTVSMGPANLRLLPLSIDLLEATQPARPVQNYHVWASLVENDSGDVDTVARKIADKTASYAAQALGGLTGVPAESVADSESFREGLATGLKFTLGDIFGIGDDPYNSSSVFLPWDAMAEGAFPDQPPVTRHGTTIAGWTHKIELNGVDDGGDPGRYVLYLRAKVRSVSVQ